MPNRFGHFAIVALLGLALLSLATAQQNFLATARDGDLAAVNAALAAGADVNATDEFGQTALMYAAGANPNPDVIRALVAAGADVNTQTLAGWTALMYAVRDNPEPQVVAVLLDLDTNVLLRNSDQRIALDYAEQNLALQNSSALSALQTSTRTARNATPAPAPTPTAAPSAPAQASATGCVNINTADRESLRRIIHIDVVRSQAIISLRPFRNVDSMTRISGIGPARVRDIKAQGLACVE